ncbi:hypothetical protein Tco_1125838 [Tanacetum coccineum]
MDEFYFSFLIALKFRMLWSFFIHSRLDVVDDGLMVWDDLYGEIGDVVGWKLWMDVWMELEICSSVIVICELGRRGGLELRVVFEINGILGLHEEQHIFGFVHGLKKRSIVEFLSTDLPTTYKGLMEKTYTWIEAKEVATNGSPSDHKEGFDKFNKGFSWDNRKGRKKNQDRRLPKPSNSLLAWSGTDDHATCPRQLVHLVKGIKKGKAKTSDTQLGEWKKGDKDIVQAETQILIVNREGHTLKRKSIEESVNGIGETTFPSVLGFDNSSDLVIIKVRISGRQVNRVYMDCGSSCEVIYEHCFLKLKPSIRSLRVDSKIPLVGFSGDHSWPLREVPLEVTVGESPYTRTETLNFVIIMPDSPYNLLLRRKTMQKIGIVVSTIHAAIKFHTPCGIGIVFSTYEPNKVEEGQKNVKETVPEVTKDVLSCVDAKERVVVNDKHPEQTIVIGKQLPTCFKRMLQDLLLSNVDVFAWTYIVMTRIPRTIMKRGLAPERNEAACKKVDELSKAGILREVKYQTWVANLVMVKKSDGGWRMCVDFTDINNACPKDCYPLPEIDWKVESL